MFIDDLPENRRIINKNTDGGPRNTYYARGIYGTMEHEPAIRIIRARIRKGILEVKALNSGLWYSVEPDLDLIYFQ